MHAEAKYLFAYRQHLPRWPQESRQFAMQQLLRIVSLAVLLVIRHQFVIWSSIAMSVDACAEEPSSSTCG